MEGGLLRHTAVCANRTGAASEASIVSTVSAIIRSDMGLACIYVVAVVESPHRTGRFARRVASQARLRGGAWLSRFAPTDRASE